MEWVEKHCRHSKGEWAGKPLMLDPNGRQMFEDIWGWRREEDGTRLYRRVFAAEPRKNGKSTKASAVALALTVGDGEPAAEVYSIAGNKNQASLVFREAQAMVRQSRELSAIFEPLANVLVCPSLNYAFYKPLPAKGKTQHGFNPHGVIGDEVHVWHGREQHDVMSSSFGARRQPLRFYITTAGDDLASLCYSEWQYALKVRDGLHTDRALLPILFAADYTDDPFDPATWYKANPNLGIAKKLSYMEERAAEAAASPAALNAFLQLELNIWVESASKWMPIKVWNDPANVAPFDPDSLIGRACYLGLDLGRTRDPSALVCVFPPAADDPCWRILARFFLPGADLAARCKNDGVPYDVWAREGVLELTEGNIADYAVIEDACFEWHQKFKAKGLGFDRMFADRTIQNLQARGVECIAVGQGVSHALPMAELERAAHGRILRHGGNPMLAWMATNVVAVLDKNNNMSPSKQKSFNRIDGIPASLNAMALYFAEHATPQSPYEHRGLLILR